MRRLVLPGPDVLATIPLFESLTPAQRARLHEKMLYPHFAAGDYIVQQEKQSDAVFFLHTGCAKVCRIPLGVLRDATPAKRNDESELILALIAPGALVGELCHFAGSGHSASVITLEPVNCFMLRAADFMAALDTYPALNHALRRHMADYALSAARRLEITALHNVAGAVAGQLLLTSERFGKAHDEGAILIDVPLTQALLAGLTGHSRERINSVLNSFKKSGCLTSAARHRFIVHDKEALHRIFCLAQPRR
jgi:CRP/FNR family transcriptional regulator, cyclic AMP receptor protein